MRTGVPGMYRRGSRYAVSYRDPSGRQRMRSAGTLVEARAVKAELTADVRRGEYRAQSRALFADYAREWAATYTGRTSRGIRPTTLERYRRDLEGHVIPVLGRRKLAEIEPRHIKMLAADLAAAGKSPSTVRNIILPVRALFATAVEEGLLRASPCTALRLPGGPGPDRRARALTEAELARLTAQVPEDWRLLVRFLSQTGLRIGELIALRWGDVDLAEHRVSVRRRLYKGTLDAPKSHYGVRDVPLSDRLAADLRTRQAGSRFSTDDDLVFGNRQGNPLRPEYVLKRVVKPAASRADVEWAGLHTLRHTCASMLFRSGWNAKQVQAVLGHHSPAFTLATYVHLIPDDLPKPVFRADVIADQAADLPSTRRGRRRGAPAR